jgi:hypothetical protein
MALLATSGLWSCKREAATEQPGVKATASPDEAAAPKAPGAAKQAPAAAAEKAAGETPTAEAGKEAGPAGAQAAAGAAAADSGASDKPAAEELKPGEAPDPASCKVRVDAEEARLQKEVVPIIAADTESTAIVKEWAEKTYKILENGEVNMSQSKLSVFWQEYQDCVKRLHAPKTERDPECVAYVTADETACQRLGTRDTIEQCVQTVRNRPFEKSLIGWARSGYSADYCSTLSPEMDGRDLHPLVCRGLAAGQKCGALGPDWNSSKSFCKAAQKGLSGADCGPDAPEGSLQCQWLRIMKAPDRDEQCRAFTKAGLSPIPVDVCAHLDRIPKLDCDRMPEFPKHLAEEEAGDPECLLAHALRNGAASCEGLFAADSNECVTLTSVRGLVSGDRTVCATLPSERSQARCRTFGATTVEECELKGGDAWGTGAKDDTPCRKLLLSRNVLPAEADRIEVRMLFVNPFQDKVACQVLVDAKGKDSGANQTIQVSLAEGEMRYQSVFFVKMTDPVVDVTPNCTWTLGPRKAPAEGALPAAGGADAS